MKTQPETTGTTSAGPTEEPEREWFYIITLQHAGTGTRLMRAQGTVSARSPTPEMLFTAVIADVMKQAGEFSARFAVSAVLFYHAEENKPL
jgi:hypothetical protein